MKPTAFFHVNDDWSKSERKTYLSVDSMRRHLVFSPLFVLTTKSFGRVCAKKVLAGVFCTWFYGLNICLIVGIWWWWLSWVSINFDGALLLCDSHTDETSMLKYVFLSYILYTTTKWVEQIKNCRIATNQNFQELLPGCWIYNRTANSFIMVCKVVVIVWKLCDWSYYSVYITRNLIRGFLSEMLEY